MKIKFVNRTNEFRFLESHSNRLNYATDVVLICGKSGVGKSELTGNFILGKKSQFPTIKVSIPQAEKNAYSSGYYIIKLARCLHEFALKDSRLLTIQDFLRSGKLSSILVKKLGENIKSDISDLIPFSDTAKGIFNLLFASGDFSPDSFFESTHSDILVTLYEYVRNQCSQKSIIINIENIQSIDQRSLELLTSIIKSSLCCLYLLEYTENDETGFSFSEITSAFEENSISLNPLFVQPLSLTDVQNIILDHPNASWELIKNSYVEWRGNMRLLVDVLAKLKYGIPIKNAAEINIQSATKDHLNSLSDSELFVLTIISVHQETVDENLLKRLIGFNEAINYIFDINVQIKTLLERKLINKSNEGISLAHDSIYREILNTGRYSLFSFIGYNFWLNIYENLLQESDVYTSKGWRLMKVLYFSSLLNLDTKVLSLLDVINVEALKSRDPEKMIKYVENVKSNLIQKDLHRYRDRILKLSLWLVEIWYKLGNSKNAWHILSEFEDNSKLYKILKAILMEQIGRHVEAINYCNLELENATNGTNYELALRLVKLVTNYDIGNKDVAINEFFVLYNNNGYTNLFEYGFLLRNAEFVFSYKGCLPYFKESIEHFKKFGATRQAAFSRITYGVHLGLSGYYSLAEEQFLLSEKELGDEITEKHTLRNNLAVLQLSQGIIDGNAEELLRLALITCSGDFERLTISMNFLVLMDWLDRRKDAQMAIETMLDVMKAPSFASKSILRYAYFDLYKYFERIGDKEQAILYLNKISTLKLRETPIWKFWLYGTPIAENDEDFYLSFRDRAISFLCNWNMEYDSSLMQYG
ncbi:hypothetical protein [Emticicia fontis]